MKIARIGIFLFSLPFAGFGVGFFIFMVYPEVNDWINSQSWQPVDAKLMAAKLESNSSSDSTTYKATATYQYFYNGVVFVRLFRRGDVLVCAKGPGRKARQLEIDNLWISHVVNDADRDFVEIGADEFGYLCGLYYQKSP